MRDFHALNKLADTDCISQLTSTIIRNNGNIASACKELGLNERSARRTLKKFEERLISRGYHPESDWTRPVPSGTLASGISTYYNAKGEVGAQWVKSSLDKEKLLQSYREAINALIDELPKYKPVKADVLSRDKDLLNLYNLFDYHFGMKSWPDETGDDWNLHIAEEMMYKTFEYGFKHTPKAHKCVINLGGDFLHWDGFTPETPASKHSLDADTRFSHVITVVVHTIRQVIEMALKKYKEVHILVQEGNHDPASSAWLRTALSHIYDKEKRITVDITPSPYYVFEHGLTSLFFHHGHLKKMQSLDTLFAARFREIYGRTKYSYAHLGHNHHKLVRESSLMITQQHSTMTAKDSYAARYGFDSMRGTEFHTYSSEVGLVNILPVSPDILTSKG